MGRSQLAFEGAESYGGTISIPLIPAIPVISSETEVVLIGQYTESIGMVLAAIKNGNPLSGSSGKGSGNAVKYADSPLMKQVDEIDSKLFDMWHRGSHETVADSLIEHYQKHRSEVGADSIAQYLRKAEGFMSNLRDAKKFNVSGVTKGVTRYVKNGKYIDLAPDGKIISFGKR